MCSNDVKSSYIAFHEHFNYIFMHFRCVLYMLSRCVLLGLDSAKPMMYLYFACHMFMHFHAYVPSFLYIFIYCCCWYFSYSFSLSLARALVYSMAPKCKSTPSQNLLRSGASSSSDPTPSIRLRDDRA